MNVLVLSDNPLSRAYGDGLRVYGLLEPLARRHRFDLLAFARPAQVPEPEATRVFRSVTVLPFPAPPRRSLRSRLVDAVAVEHFRASSPAMKDEIARRIDRGEVDLVLDVACNMLLNLPRELKVPLVIDSIDEALLRDLRDLKSAPWRFKPRLAHQTWMFWRYERRTMARAAANVYASPIDAEAYRRFFPGRAASVVPNGVDTTFYSPIDVEHEPATVVFEGNLMFGPNVDAARRLALDILPRIVAEIPAARLVLVGRDPSPEVSALASARVVVTGTVADVRPYLARGTVFACPMRLGSGIKNKILQAWAMARPVVASTASLGGLAAKDDYNALVRDDDRSFAAAVVELMRDGQRAARIGRNGRETVEREYAWTRRAGQFEDVLAAALASWRASRDPVPHARSHTVQVRRTEVGNESTGARP